MRARPRSRQAAAAMARAPSVHAITHVPRPLGSSATKPLVVRLDGNNVDEGRRILAEYAHPRVTVVETMDEAADKAAELANK